MKLLAIEILRYLDYKFSMPKFAKGNALMCFGGRHTIVMLMRQVLAAEIVVFYGPICTGTYGYSTPSTPNIVYDLGRRQLTVNMQMRGSILY